MSKQVHQKTNLLWTNDLGYLVGFKSHISPAGRPELFKTLPHGIREVFMALPLTECYYSYLKHVIRNPPSR